jgi:ATP-binding cassette, subfamily B, bacterial
MMILKNYNIPTVIKSIRMLGNKYKLFLTCVFIFCAVEAAGIPFYTYGIKGVVTAISGHNQSLFLQSMLLIVISFAMWWVVAPVSTYFCADASKGAIRDIKTGLIDHIIRLPQKDLDSRANGDFLSAFSNDIACLQNIYDWSFFQVLSSAAIGLAGIVMMAVIDWRFSIVVFTLGTASVLTTSYYSKKLEKAGQEVQERLAKSSTDAYELIKKAKTIRLLKLCKLITRNFSKSTALESEAKMSGGRTNAKMNTIIIGISALSYLAILGIGALFVYYKISDWGTVVALTGLKDTADDLFLKCGQFMAGMQKNIAGVKRILDIDKIEEEKLSEDDGFRFEQNNIPLKLQDVCFAYSESTPVIKNINLKIEDHKLTALIGKSGCGKSTVMKLMMALYHPTVGKITFRCDGDLSLAALRSMTAYVPQEPMLFHGSVYENIACGKEGCSSDDVISAAKQAGADGFILAMEKGYNTILIDDGKNLSGGQRQRIALARALVKEAPVLLLDEITSMLDRDTEEQILETVKNISKLKAVLMITHKPEIEKIADCVIHLQKT